MSVEYFLFPTNGTKINIGSLSIRKSQKIAQFFVNSKLVENIDCYALETEDNAVIETIVFDFLSDSVPPNNSVGLNYSERLALEIYSDESRLIRVLALRKNFPLLPHQNHTRAGDPKELCLYFEPADVVNRTWTAQNLLFRIQNWIVKSSLGILHADDQPLENQFFESPYELILPWDYKDKAANNIAGNLAIENVVTRSNETKTIILSENQNSNFNPFKIVRLFLPKIVHGQIHVHPSSLEEMHDYMATHGLDFHKVMRDAIIPFVKGGYAPAPGEMTFFLLHIPLCRQENLEPEKIQIIGLVCLKNIGEIGKACQSLKRAIALISFIRAN